MSGVWSSLTPLFLGSALVPIQLVLTVLLLRSREGVKAAAGFLLGMTVVRLAQGALFGLVFANSSNAEKQSSSSGYVLATLLLVIGVVLLASGVRALAGHDDPDAPPPKWMTIIDSVSPLKAFALGGGLLLIQPKFWVFTLGAISAIGQSNLGQPSATLTYLAFVALAEILIISLVIYAAVFRERSVLALVRISTWLESNNRHLMVGVGLVFGLWFSIKGLAGLGVF